MQQRDPFVLRTSHNKLEALVESALQAKNLMWLFLDVPGSRYGGRYLGGCCVYMTICLRVCICSKIYTYASIGQEEV